MKHVCLFFALLLVACKPTPSVPQPLGERLVEGHLSELRLLPGETHLRFLADAKSPQLQETASSLKLGKLFLYHLHSRKLTQIGAQVSSLTETQHATSDGKYLVFLDDFNPQTKTGSLRCARVVSATVGKAFGKEVSFFVVSPQGQHVAFVDGGTLKLGPLPEGPFRVVAEGVANAEFSLDGGTLAFKKRLEARGQLWVAKVEEEKPPRLIAENTGDYRLSKDGKKLLFAAREKPQHIAFQLLVADTDKAQAPRLLSQEMFRFALSPDERFVAYAETKTPEKPGTLWVKPLEGEGAGRMLGERVRDFEFASHGQALAWREAYYGDEGQLAVVSLQDNAEPKRLSPRTRHWQWNTQGSALAYTATVSAPEFPVSVDLFSFRLGEKAPTKIHTWVYEYAFAVDGESLLFEANCIREGRSCALLQTKVGEGEGGSKAKLAEGVYSFRQSADGQHIYWLHLTPLTPVQTQLWASPMATPKPQKLADNVHMPPPLPLDKTGTKFLYLSNQPQHEGLYLTVLKP